MTEPAAYRARPTTVRAIRFDGTNADAFLAHAGPAACRTPRGLILFSTPTVMVPVNNGDWCVTHSDGSRELFDGAGFESRYVGMHEV